MPQKLPRRMSTVAAGLQLQVGRWEKLGIRKEGEKGYASDVFGGARLELRGGRRGGPCTQRRWDKRMQRRWDKCMQEALEVRSLEDEAQRKAGKKSQTDGHERPAPI